jgi:hypothetical protein
MEGNIEIHIVVNSGRDDEDALEDLEKLGQYAYGVLKEAGFTNVHQAESGWLYSSIPYQTPSLLAAMKESNPGLFNRPVTVDTWCRDEFKERFIPKEPPPPKTLEQKINRPFKHMSTKEPA